MPRDRGAVAVGFEPTEGFPLTRFRGVLLRPLGHATAGEATGPAGPRKNARSSAPALLGAHARRDLGAVVEPAVADDVPQRAGGTRPSGRTAPKTTRSTRASTLAPAHIVQGSSVTTSVQPVSRQLAAAARRRAQRQHLGVRGGVAALLPLVGRLGEHRAVRPEDDRADRRVAPLLRGRGELERPAHRGVDVQGGAGVAPCWRTQGGLGRVSCSGAEARPARRPGRPP